MDWVAFHQPGGPLAFTYPKDWTIRADDGLQLVSPAGSVLHWTAFRAPDDRGDEVTVEQAGPQRWTLSRRKVVVKVAYTATDDATEAEQELVEAIVRSTRPDPGLPKGASAFVDEVLEEARRAFPDRAIDADGMSLRVDGQTVVDLAAAYRDARVHPQSRMKRVDQVISLLALKQQPVGSWQEASASVFPMLVPVHDAAHRHTRSFNELLSIAYAIDLGPIMRRVTAPHLADWDVDEQALHDAALANLARHTTFRSRSRPETGHSLTVIGGHTFATAEILLPRFREALVPTLGEAFLVALPSRDVVAAAAFQDEAEIRRFAQWAFAADAFPCTDQLFKSRADGQLDP